jgi:DNA-binding beta-propeller fold protein YncE
MTRDVDSRLARRGLLFFISALGLALCFMPAAANASGTAYIPDFHNVLQYSIGTEGELSALIGTVSAGSSTLVIAVNPNGKSVYAGNAGPDDTVAQYDVDPATGTLSPKTPATVPIGGVAGGIAVTPDGKSAYVPNQGNGVAQYDIDPLSGNLSPKSAKPIVGFGDIAITPDGKSAYITLGGNDNVGMYSIDPVTGALSFKPHFAVDAGHIPDAVAVTPDGKSAYVANFTSGDVSQYTIDPYTGELSPKTPPRIAGAAGLTGVAVTPDGRSAYVSGFSRTVLQYDIDPVGGKLSPKTPASVPTGYYSTGVAVNPDGHSAYVADQGVVRPPGDVSQYSIDPRSGALSPKTPARVTAGGTGAPQAIAIGPFPRVPSTKDQCKRGGWHNFPQFKNQGECVTFVEHST